MPSAPIEVLASAENGQEIPQELIDYAARLTAAEPREAEKSGTLERNQQSVREAMTAKMQAVPTPAGVQATWSMFHYVAGPRPDQWFEIGATNEQATDSVYDATDSTGAKGYLAIRYVR